MPQRQAIQYVDFWPCAVMIPCTRLPGVVSYEDRLYVRPARPSANDRAVRLAAHRRRYLSPPPPFRDLSAPMANEPVWGVGSKDAGCRARPGLGQPRLDR